MTTSSACGTFMQEDEGASLLHNRPFLFSAFMSAALRLVSLLLYQSAIQLAPLSVTIPYLSFTPAMLLCTAYVMIGERPSWSGLVGVMIVTLGGYLLAFSSSFVASKKDKDNPEDGNEDSKSSNPAYGTVDESIGHLEMGSKLLVMTDGVHKGLGGVAAGAVRSLQQLGDSKGSVLMVLVAFLWSMTSAFDKIGMAASPTLASYLAVQRAMTAVPCVFYLLAKDSSAFRHLCDDFMLLAGLVASELLTVLLYLWSLKFLFVSYAVAAKRTGILLSVLSGWLFFGERIQDKILYILLMLSGMLLIVLAPDIQYNRHLSRP